MKLLIVAATDAEITPLNEYLQHTTLPNSVAGEILITGVGMTNTCYELTKHLQTNKYDLVLQVGVAGSFVKNLALGDVVFVTSDQFGDLGAEDKENYVDIFEMGLVDKNTSPYIIGKLLTPLLPIHNKIILPKVSSITVNTVSGRERTIHTRYNKYHCDLESMEGAALHYVCLQEKTTFAQVRSISNYVTPRDRSQWQMKEAITNLNKWLINFINEL